jgi:hypothetical protein
VFLSVKLSRLPNQNHKLQQKSFVRLSEGLDGGEIGGFAIKLFTALINSEKARAFATSGQFHPSLMFENKAGAYTSGAH